MTKEELALERDRLAGKQWRSFVKDKACCVEHLCTTSYSNGFNAATDLLMPEVERLRDAVGAAEILIKDVECGCDWPPGNTCAFHECADALKRRREEVKMTNRELDALNAVQVDVSNPKEG